MYRLLFAAFFLGCNAGPVAPPPAVTAPPVTLSGQRLINVFYQYQPAESGLMLCSPETDGVTFDCVPAEAAQ